MSTSPNTSLETELEESGAEDPLEFSGHLETNRRQEKQAESAQINTTRRAVLGAAAAGMAGAAGCNEVFGEESNDPRPPAPDIDTSTETTPEQSEFDEVDPNLSFEEVYEETVDTSESHLTEGQAEEIKSGRTRLVDQVDQTLDKIIKNDDVNPRELELTHAIQEAVYNDLGYSTDEVFIDLRATGGGQMYKAVFTKNGDDWEKHLSRNIEILKNRQEGGGTNNQEMLYQIWNQDDITMGSATGFETWREGVEKSNFFTERVDDNRSALAGMANFNFLNDEIIVNDYKRETVEEGDREAKFGDISFTRPVANMMREIQDFDENEVFNTEVELMKNLTEFYHGSYEPDENTYIQIGTEEELREDLEEGVADKPYQLTTLDETTLYASEINAETHKENIWNSQVPESQFPEYAYPGNVEIPDEWLNGE